MNISYVTARLSYRVTSAATLACTWITKVMSEQLWQQTEIRHSTLGLYQRYTPTLPSSLGSDGIGWFLQLIYLLMLVLLHQIEQCLAWRRLAMTVLLSCLNLKQCLHWIFGPRQENLYGAYGKYKTSEISRKCHNHEAQSSRGHRKKESWGIKKNNKQTKTNKKKTSKQTKKNCNSGAPL